MYELANNKNMCLSLDIYIYIYMHVHIYNLCDNFGPWLVIFWSCLYTLFIYVDQRYSIDYINIYLQPSKIVSKYFTDSMLTYLSTPIKNYVQFLHTHCLPPQGSKSCHIWCVDTYVYIYICDMCVCHAHVHNKTIALWYANSDCFDSDHLLATCSLLGNPDHRIFCEYRTISISGCFFQVAPQRHENTLAYKIQLIIALRFCSNTGFPRFPR